MILIVVVFVGCLDSTLGFGRAAWFFFFSPTIQGMVRRGLKIEALTQFILEQVIM